MCYACMIVKTAPCCHCACCCHTSHTQHLGNYCSPQTCLRFIRVHCQARNVVLQHTVRPGPSCTGFQLGMPTRPVFKTNSRPLNSRCAARGQQIEAHAWANALSGIDASVMLCQALSASTAAGCVPSCLVKALSPPANTCVCAFKPRSPQLAPKSVCITSAPNEGFPQQKGTCQHRSERWPASCFRVRSSLEFEPCSACCSKQTCTDRILHCAGPSRVGHTTVQRQEAGLRLCMYSAEGNLISCLHGHFLMQNTRPPSQSTTGTSSRQISHSMPRVAPTMLAPRCENHMLLSGRVYRRVETVCVALLAHLTKRSVNLSCRGYVPGR